MVVLKQTITMRISSGLITLFIAAVILAFGNNKERKYLEGMGFRYVPAAEVTIDDETRSIKGFYMYETEITNKQYYEFLTSLRKDKRFADARVAAIDSSQWLEALSFENTYMEDYHLTAEFAEYPVVNISYEGALLFCGWLEERINKRIEGAEVRLPTYTEWVHAARGGKQDAIYPWDNIGMKGKKEHEFCNYNSPDDGTCLATNYAKSYYPNAYGLYNMSGNVAEMLHERGWTKGGSWDSPATEMKIDAEDTYAGFSGPSPYIGFRPVVILP
jgi:sulfatase modifying factor 1